MGEGLKEVWSVSVEVWEVCSVGCLDAERPWEDTLGVRETQKPAILVTVLPASCAKLFRGMEMNRKWSSLIPGRS